MCNPVTDEMGPGAAFTTVRPGPCQYECVFLYKGECEFPPGGGLSRKQSSASGLSEKDMLLVSQRSPGEVLS